MIFLIEYNRREGRIVTMRSFDDQQRAEADRVRLEKELDLSRARIEHEVVILEAQSEEHLHKTHRRYFGDFPPLPSFRETVSK